MPDMTGQKVYFPVESLVGLGHFNRAGKIVRDMARAGLDVTVASGTFADPKRFFAGARRAALPAYVFCGAGTPYTLKEEGRRTLLPHFNAQAWTQDRIGAHLRNIAALRPDIVMSELWPFGRPEFDPEMQAVLAAAKGARLRLASVRDVLDPPARESGEDRDAFAARTINDGFDAVLVHGDPRFMPLGETFSAAHGIAAKTIYTGYVLNDLPVRKAPDPRRGPLVVSCGSGADAQEMIFSFLTAWQKLRDRGAHDPAAALAAGRPVHIVCGPRFPGEAYGEVAAWARALGQGPGRDITVEKYRRDFTALLAGAAFSVSLGGYNTTLETLALGVPALLIPKYAFEDGRVMASAEQLHRLTRLAQHGLAAMAAPEDVQDASRFADILAREIARQTAGEKPRARLALSGAAHTVAAVAALLEERRGDKKTYAPPARLSL